MDNGIQTYYVINGKKFLDSYQFRQILDLKRFELQYLMKYYDFPKDEIIMVQNKKLYSINVLRAFIERLIEKNERGQIKSTFNQKAI